jgi:hypothetical protein
MIEHPQTQDGPALSTLALGIINDVQSLVKQQLALFQNELKKDVHQAQGAVVVLIGGVGFALVGLTLFGVMAAFAIQSVAPTWSLATCFGVSGLAFATVGAILLLVGKKKLSSVNPLPTDSVEVMKENVQWIMKNPRT